MRPRDETPFIRRAQRAARAFLRIGSGVGRPTENLPLALFVWMIGDSLTAIAESRRKPYRWRGEDETQPRNCDRDISDCRVNSRFHAVHAPRQSWSRATIRRRLPSGARRVRAIPAIWRIGRGGVAEAIEGRAQAVSRRAMIARRCNRRCHPVRPLTRLIAPCGISKPKDRGVCRPMLPQGSIALPPVSDGLPPSASIRRKPCMKPSQAIRSFVPILKIKGSAPEKVISRGINGRA